MEATPTFDLDQFIADLRAALAECSRQAVRGVVARAVCDPASLLRQIGEPDKAAVRVLHQATDLTVLNVVWAPKQVTLPHDHRMSAVIGIYGGRKDNTFWRRVSNPAKFQIEPAGGEALGTGDVTILGRPPAAPAISVRRIKLAIASACPYAHQFGLAHPFLTGGVRLGT